MPTFRNSLPFADWWTWCHTCRHGGHASHLAEWFANQDVCPVADCRCHCNSLDVNPTARQPRELLNAVPVPADDAGSDGDSLPAPAPRFGLLDGRSEAGKDEAAYMRGRPGPRGAQVAPPSVAAATDGGSAGRRWDAASGADTGRGSVYNSGTGENGDASMPTTRRIRTSSVSRGSRSYSAASSGEAGIPGTSGTGASGHGGSGGIAIGAGDDYASQRAAAHHDASATLAGGAGAAGLGTGSSGGRPGAPNPLVDQRLADALQAFGFM